MAKSKVKEATVPLKGEKKSKAPKASVTARAKPSQLSEENVIDSGSESESGSSGGGSDTESEDEKRQNTKKPDVRKVKVMEPEEPAVPDDTSSDGEEDEDESESETEKAKSKPVAKNGVPQANGTKRKVDESSSEDEESEDELPDAPLTKKARTESEVSDAEDGSNDKMEVDAPALLPGVVASSVSAQPFQPPEGYKSLNSKGRSALSANDLQDKQIWHITAPSHVPLSSLSEVALDAIQSGKPILTHERTNYVLSEDKTHQSSSENILLPGKDGYTRVSHPVSRTLHLRQHVELPNLTSKQADQNAGSNMAAHVATAAVTGIRPQPRGMKMRYKPPGFGSGDPGRIGSDPESEDEDSGAGAVFQFPKKIGMSGEPTTNPEIVETPKKKTDKKDKEKKSEKKSKKKDKA